MKEFPDKPIPELLNDTFVKTDIQLSEMKHFSGCTSIISLMRLEDRQMNTKEGSEPYTKKVRVLYTANVGDARAVLWYVLDFIIIKF